MKEQLESKLNELKSAREKILSDFKSKWMEVIPVMVEMCKVIPIDDIKIEYGDNYLKVMYGEYNLIGLGNYTPLSSIIEEIKEADDILTEIYNMLMSYEEPANDVLVPEEKKEKTFNVGDRVIVTRRATEKECINTGWNEHRMNRTIGKIHTITQIIDDNMYLLNTSDYLERDFWYPPEVLELV